jgi:hypothetical protein
MLERVNYTASFIYTAYTVYKSFCPNDDTWQEST